MENQNIIQKNHFHFGHVGLVFSVAVLLLGVSWMREPDLFALRFEKNNTESLAKLPQYYAYAEPAEFSQPMVAGASTEPQGPSIINEDGTLSPVVEQGSVLGISTSTIDQLADTTNVKLISDSEENFQKYSDESGQIENGSLNNYEFENALSTASPELLNEQSKKIESIISALQNLNVPASFKKMHQLKLVQYNAAVQILKNFVNADQNPELVTNALGTFMQAQDILNTEMKFVETKLNLNNAQ